MKSNAKCYQRLRDYVETIKLVDCHDHSETLGPNYIDPIEVIVNGYFASDLNSASSDRDIELLVDAQLSIEQRWPILERAWKRTCHTGYAQMTKRMLKKFYGEDELSLEALKRMAGKMLDLESVKTHEDILEDANIVVRLQNILREGLPGTKKVMDGSFVMPPRSRLVVRLPSFHGICNYEAVRQVGAIVGRTVTSLDEYLEVCREVFEGYKRFGAVAFKDQSAYQRSLTYENPTRGQAEEVFNWFMADPRRSACYPDGVKHLDDFLFHQFMRMARDFDLPVQIHTGHMAGIRNDIAKTNAVGLRSVLELHQDVRFDLFHANWPYSGELLYLAKNYPNVAIDFCWANIIDPVYCQNMFKQALSCVPHGKIHGYGSDLKTPDRAWAHASIARDNVAIGLAEMVEAEYIGFVEAQQIAYDWLFGNANEFFRLGL